jgi:predicted kinase
LRSAPAISTPLQRIHLSGYWYAAEQRRLDASDADAAVIRLQLAQDVGEVAWRRIDSSRTLDDVLRAATAVLGEHLKSGVIRLSSQAA